MATLECIIPEGNRNAFLVEYIHADIFGAGHKGCSFLRERRSSPPAVLKMQRAPDSRSSRRAINPKMAPLVLLIGHPAIRPDFIDSPDAVEFKLAILE
jgi:hypothetical protein